MSSSIQALSMPTTRFPAALTMNPSRYGAGSWGGVESKAKCLRAKSSRKQAKLDRLVSEKAGVSSPHVLRFASASPLATSDAPSTTTGVTRTAPAAAETEDARRVPANGHTEGGVPNGTIKTEAGEESGTSEHDESAAEEIVPEVAIKTEEDVEEEGENPVKTEDDWKTEDIDSDRVIKTEEEEVSISAGPHEIENARSGVTIKTEEVEEEIFATDFEIRRSRIVHMINARVDAYEEPARAEAEYYARRGRKRSSSVASIEIPEEREDCAKRTRIVLRFYVPRGQSSFHY